MSFPPTIYARLKTGLEGQQDSIYPYFVLFLATTSAVFAARCFRSYNLSAKTTPQPHPLFSSMVSIIKKPFVSYYCPPAAQPAPRLPPTPVFARPTVEPNFLAVGRQLYDAFLVLDVEATCAQGTDFAYPNEIIVCL
jgi:hypothetical protein